MATVSASIVIPAPPDEVWAAVGDPAAISTFAPFVAAAAVDGDARVCEMVGGGTVRELIVTHDPVARRYVYSVREAPFPLDFHRAEVRVEPEGAGSRLTWSADVKPDSVAALVQPNLDAVVDGAAALVAARARG